MPTKTAVSGDRLTVSVDRSTDVAASAYRAERKQFWEDAPGRPTAASSYYHDRLRDLFGFVISPGLDVIELGCGRGDLLASLKPRRGVGVDFSSKRIAEARTRHPQLEFWEADVHELETDERFDVIVLSDLLNDVWDVQAVLEQIQPLCKPSTRIVISFFNRVWQGPISAARRFGLAGHTLRQNWLSNHDVENLLRLSDFEVVTRHHDMLVPFRLGPISTLLNRYLVKLWPIWHLATTSVVVARPAPSMVVERPELKVSVIVPARNEAGNIEDIINRTPQMGTGTELIFVEGNSTDDTYEAIKRALEKPGREHVSLYQQPGKGKGDAVRHGYAHATGDVLMILDADMTVAPEELPRFYQALADGTGEFINGVRLVYPMEGEAMRALNFVGNKFFSVAFSWLLRQPVKDTLCGTKVLTADSYDAIAANRSYFGDFDPFGDFDLLFGASKNNLQIVDLPLRYRDRTYGDTNIDRWRHGVVLLRMAAFAARKLKFV